MASHIERLGLPGESEDIAGCECETLYEFILPPHVAAVAVDTFQGLHKASLVRPATTLALSLLIVTHRPQILRTSSHHLSLPLQSLTFNAHLNPYNNKFLSATVSTSLQQQRCSILSLLSNHRQDDQLEVRCRFQEAYGCNDCCS